MRIIGLVIGVLFFFSGLGYSQINPNNQNGVNPFPQSQQNNVGVTQEICRRVCQKARVEYFGPLYGYSDVFLWRKFVEGSLVIEERGSLVLNGAEVGVFKVTFGNDWAIVLIEIL